MPDCDYPVPAVVVVSLPQSIQTIVNIIVMDDGDLLIDNTFNNTIGAVVVLGMFLVVVALALFKFYLDYQHNQAKEQAHWNLMEEYQDSKSGAAERLRQEVIATRTDSEMQRMMQEESEQILRQRHKKEMEEEHRSHKLRLEAKMCEVEKQKQEDLKEKQKNQERIRVLQGEVSTWTRRSEYYKSELEKQNRKVLDEADAYREVRAKYDSDLKLRDDKIADLEEENKQFQQRLQEKEENNIKLQAELEELKNSIAMKVQRKLQSVWSHNKQSKEPPNEYDIKYKHDTRGSSTTATSCPPKPAAGYDSEDSKTSGQDSTV